MSKNANERTTRRGGLRFHLAAVVVVALSLAVPAIAAAHPAVYDVTKKVVPGGCEWPNTGGCMNDGAKRYVVVNHNIPVAYDETNGLGESYGGVINFQRFPGSYRSTVPTPADWLAVLPPRTGVQAHATCESTPPPARPASSAGRGRNRSTPTSPGRARPPGLTTTRPNGSASSKCSPAKTSPG